jgi:glycosyltransferase involved in cell wall biosynthesis
VRVALVHEHLAQDGGAERVLMVLAGMFPDAPIFTLLHNPTRANPFFLKRDIRTSFLQRVPGSRWRYQWLLPFMANAIESFDFSGYDLVISSASAFAKGVITPPDVPHLCYCHSPTRYLWTDSHRYVRELPYPGIVKAGIRRYLTGLRQWDRLAADRVDAFVANSRTVAARIRKFYRRESTVIEPPVDVHRFSVSRSRGQFFLAGGRLVAYKRVDLAVAAFNRLGLPLHVFGSGPEERKLKAMAKPNVRFLGRVSDEALKAEYRDCTAYLHPQEEDFGIAAIEAMASGRPVVAYNRGGAAETVVPGQTGVLFEDQTWEALADAVIRLKPDAFDPEAIRRHAEGYGVERFTARFKQFVDQTVAGYGVAHHGT